MMKRDLFNSFFHFGYITKDIDAACDIYTKKFGAKFKIYTPKVNLDNISPVQHIAFSYIGNTMIKIIEPDLAQNSIFNEYVVENPKVIRLHHLGYLMMNDYQKTLKQLGWNLEYDIPLKGNFENLWEFAYADTRKDFGHYTEFIQLDEVGKDFLADIPGIKKAMF
ncbi:VOC family protein [Chryseobacterium sp. Ch-15]|uniref:VOC family protein n=1 Tax=Chryseobacterium muglaense TaxID=2893752 RepID=A0A9Q3UUZ8_9FLAO|nr:VOC family protein [Chryseobacterium muglaense]MBD3903303.1 VOC family protein [Chryseobacterium muglaense]MCC9036133.1 VOC family protein [Chryseobacterium muglaense]MCM2553291.1 VOC family protein [Chryseobacterium muglaense]